VFTWDALTPVARSPCFKVLEKVSVVLLAGGVGKRMKADRWVAQTRVLAPAQWSWRRLELTFDQVVRSCPADSLALS
jgi:molybdopterin-guanine dinucleotide biosynthesis protein A